MTAPDARPWYETFFGRDYLAAYGYLFSPERAEEEAAFVFDALALRAGDEVLDLCCGQGRHAVPLARRGCKVTGLDLSQQYLDLLADAAAKAGVEVETVRSDMREIPFEARFDAVINMFSSFGYLETEAEDARVLRAVARALKPGGRFLLDLLNREWALINYDEKDWHRDEDGTVYLEERSFDPLTSRNHVTFTAISPDGTRREMGGHHLRLYTLREVRGLLEEAGLTVQGVFGGYDGQPYA
ncbi:MAG TPA: class I SAM-dependent methyltransferase, partial [Dehalococcoidia bacterium]|nr:class I SAM-dependent methyltransferase [Dehalococcoidia bacterium]